MSAETFRSQNQKQTVWRFIFPQQRPYSSAREEKCSPLWLLLAKITETAPEGYWVLGMMILVTTSHCLMGRYCLHLQHQGKFTSILALSVSF